MFERPDAGNAAIVVHPEIYGIPKRGDLDEFIDLARSAGLAVLESVEARLSRPDPGHLLGKGKLDELEQLLIDSKADMLLVNHELAPVQERNLERRFKCRVIDRTTLILDIFAQRARSHEGKLQVELAQLRHLSTRLVRGWTHLERQKGGIGLRGPGETQLETDRRLIGERIKMLDKRLEKVERQREQSRRARRRNDAFIISLVGYTNAGKSTLFNRMTGSSVYAADKLFATLDPTLRHYGACGGQPILLADTVGFVSDLPHDLVAAFRSTLKETREADLLLQVVDAATPDADERMADVETVLEEIKANEVPQLRVFNKIDCLGDAPRLVRDEHGRVTQVWLSAMNGDGLDLLETAIVERLSELSVTSWLHLPPQAGRLRAKLHDAGAVLEERYCEDGFVDMKIMLTQARLGELASDGGEARRYLAPLLLDSASNGQYNEAAN